VDRGEIRVLGDRMRDERAHAAGGVFESADVELRAGELQAIASTRP
jgi:hypothetical protein